MNFLRTASSLLLASLLTTGSVNAELNLELPDYNLPDFKPPGSQATGNIDEPVIGRQLFRKLRQSRPWIEDPELQYWLNGLVQRLVKQTPGLGKTLKVVLTNNPAINAYALPGGIIVINSGLLLSTATESELAAVLAHEMAHISQNHLNRMRANSQNNPLITGIGLLAGAAVGSKNPEAGQAIITSTLALNAQQQISYSQQYELEADRVGLRILAGAGLNPLGMPHFLEKLERNESGLYGDLSKYLRSHPLTIERLGDTRNRAQQYGRRPGRESIDYLYAREKLRTHFDRHNTAPASVLPPAVQRYRQALLQQRRGDPRAVLQTLQKQPQTLANSLLKADALNTLKRYQEAEQLLRPYQQRYPQHEAVLIIRAQALTGNNKPAQAWRLLQTYPIHEQTSLEFLERAQHIARQTGQQQAAVLYHAERNLRLGQYKYARLALKQALRDQTVAADMRRRLQKTLAETEAAEKELEYLKSR